MPVPLTINDFLDRASAVYPDRVAIFVASRFVVAIGVVYLTQPNIRPVIDARRFRADVQTIQSDGSDFRVQ